MHQFKCVQFKYCSVGESRQMLRLSIRSMSTFIGLVSIRTRISCQFWCNIPHYSQVCYHLYQPCIRGTCLALPEGCTWRAPRMGQSLYAIQTNLCSPMLKIQVLKRRERSQIFLVEDRRVRELTRTTPPLFFFFLGASSSSCSRSSLSELPRFPVTVVPSDVVGQ